MPHLDEGLLTALLDNELGQADRQAAETHLAGCEDCRRLYDEVRALATEADGLVAEIELPPKAAPKVAPPGPPAGASGTGPGRWRTLAWAASLVLAVGLGWAASDLRYFADRPAGPGETSRLADSAGKDRYRADQPVTAQAPAAAPAPPATTSAPASAMARTPAAPSQPKLNKEEKAPAVSPGVVGGGAAAPSKPAEVGAFGNASLDQERARENELRVDAVAGAPAPRAPEPQAVKDRRLLPRAEADLRGPSGTRLRQVGMEEAVRTLGGSIRLIDGLQPERILLGAGSLADGVDSSLDVVRVVYQDPPGRELWLDQQRPIGLEGRGQRSMGLIPGDTLISLATTGANGVRWIDEYGFRLALTGYLPVDSLRAMLARVH
jgi:hypothetical protein